VDANVSETRRGGHVVVALRGELDVATSGAVTNRLLELIAAGEVGLVVDLEKVQFMDSSGVSALVVGHNAARANGAEMLVVCSDRGLLKLFEVSQLDKLLTIYPSVEAAVA
jgi:anti-sigma B factor antagonist